MLIDSVSVSRLMSALHRLSLSASGVLKGFDPLLNLVLDGTIEYMRGKLSGFKLSAGNVNGNLKK